MLTPFEETEGGWERLIAAFLYRWGFLLSNWVFASQKLPFFWSQQQEFEDFWNVFHLEASQNDSVLGLLAKIKCRMILYSKTVVASWWLCYCGNLQGCFFSLPHFFQVQVSPPRPSPSWSLPLSYLSVPGEWWSPAWTPGRVWFLLRWKDWVSEQSGIRCRACCLSASLLCKFLEPKTAVLCCLIVEGTFIPPWTDCCDSQLPNSQHPSTLLGLSNIRSCTHHLQSACNCPVSPRYWKKYKLL